MRKISPWLSNAKVAKMLNEPVRFYESMTGYSQEGIPVEYTDEHKRMIISDLVESVLNQIARTEILRGARLSLDVELAYDEPLDKAYSYIRMRAVVRDKV